jgi:hypothetical protein
LFWTHLIENLGDVGHVEFYFSLFGDIVSVGARWVHGLRQTYHWLRNCFRRTRWFSEMTRLKWKLDSICLGIVLILTQDRFMVCAEDTIGSKIVLDTLDRTPR